MRENDPETVNDDQGDAGKTARRERGKRQSVAKKLSFSLIPICVILVTIEAFFRMSGFAKSPITPMTLPGERAGIYRYDKNLYWSLKPNQKLRFQNVTVSTNSHGLRSDEIRDGGFRILSLGESSTFGAGVENWDTYSSVLQSYLNKDLETEQFQVINGGVSAYSSFQSLMYLRTAGVDLKPDVVIFYHEINDYLPTYLRASDNTVIGMGLTDQERFESRSRRNHRRMLELSATYRFISYRIAFRKLESMQKETNQQAAANGRAMSLAMVESEMKPMVFPTRVSPEERARNLEQLLDLCKQHNIKLVLIHPTYRDSVRHECVLTQFCKRHDVPMLEAYDALHPPDSRPDAYFWDGMHPTIDGHEQLAKHLHRLLVYHGLVDNKKKAPEVLGVD